MDLQTAFHDQATSCRNLDSPFMGRLLDLLAAYWPTDTALARKCATFQGDIGPAGQSLPLRICGGLHALRLQDRAGLSAVYPPQQPGDVQFKDVVLSALETEDAFLTAWIDSPPQTNELRRSAALIPGAMIAAARFDLPVYLSELGASGGLNMMWDHFALDGPGWHVGAENAAVRLAPDWTGPPPKGRLPRIAARRGVDLNPLDPTDPGDLLRLTAYLWADQPHRLENTRKAASSVAAPVDRGDAIEWLETRLSTAPDAHLHIVQNTVAWQYFPQELQARGKALLAAAGAEATASRPLAWLQLETDGDRHGLGGAAITLQIWPGERPGGEVLHLGRADFHGRWVRWTGHANS